MDFTSSPSLLQVAKIIKSNGTDGEVLISFKSIAPEDLKLKEPVFIFFDGLPVPFFVSSYSTKGAGRAFARLTGVASLGDAEEIVGKDVYVETGKYEDFDSMDDGLDLSILVGWSVVTPDNTKVGEIVEIEDIPGNPCLDVGLGDGRMVLLPFHEDLIAGVDKKKRILTMDIPDGLVD